MTHILPTPVFISHSSKFWTDIVETVKRPKQNDLDGNDKTKLLELTSVKFYGVNLTEVTIVNSPDRMGCNEIFNR